MSGGRSHDLLLELGWFATEYLIGLADHLFLTDGISCANHRVSHCLCLIYKSRATRVPLFVMFEITKMGPTKGDQA